MADKTQATNQALLKQNFISQNAYDNSESSFGVSQGTVKSAEAQVQLARNALRDAVAMSPLAGVVAKRHVQPGEKVAFDSPARHRRRPDGHGTAGRGAGGRRAGARDRQGGRAFDRRLRRAPLHRTRRADQPGRRAGNAGHPRLRRNSESGRRAARGDVRDGPHRARRQRPGRHVAGDGRAHRGRADVRVDGRGWQARQARRRHRPPRRRRRAHRGQDRAAAGRAGARRALRQPEGRRAGDRQGPRVAARAGTRVGADIRPARRPRADPRPTEEQPPCGSHASRSTTRSSPRW